MSELTLHMEFTNLSDLTNYNAEYAIFVRQTNQTGE